MKRFFITAAVEALVLTASDRDDENELNGTDREFVRMAAISNTAEIQAGQLAASKGTSLIVNAYGCHMVTEHGTAQTDLKKQGISSRPHIG